MADVQSGLTPDQRDCLSVIMADPNHVATVEIKGRKELFAGFWTPVDVFHRLAETGRLQASPDRRLRELVDAGRLMRVTPVGAGNRVLYGLRRELSPYLKTRVTEK